MSDLFSSILVAIGVIAALPSTIVLTLLMYPASLIGSLLLGEKELAYDMFVRSSVEDIKNLIGMILGTLS